MLSSKLFLSNRIARHGYGLVSRRSCSFDSKPKSSSSRRYSERHEWASKEKDSIYKIGISQYAQEALGDVVFVQLPEVGSVLHVEQECGAMESVKAVSEIYSPLGGKVTEINDALENNPSLVNKSCYGDGWLFKLECYDQTGFHVLMSEEEYDLYLKFTKKDDDK